MSASTENETPVRLEIDGMHCSSCVAHVEEALTSVDGVDSATVSLADSTAEVRGAGITAPTLVDAVRSAGYGAEPIALRRSLAEERIDLERRVAARALRWRRRVVIGLATWFPLAFVHWFGGLLGLPRHSLSLDWIVAGVASVAFFYVGFAFFQSAWEALRARTANMDTLVSVGAISAYLFSSVELVLRTTGEGQVPLYFVEVAGLLAFIAFGHWLEARTTAAAGGALRDLLALQPDEVVRLADRADTSGTVVPSASIRPGQFILVRPGDRVAVDGSIIEGRSAMDESAVTGEPIPVERGPGEPVVAGTISTNGRLVVETTTDGDATTISRIAEIVRAAQATKTRIQRLADRIAGVFVPIVFAVAAITLGAWWTLGGEQGLADGIINAVTVLVIACPCALGLATPTAVMAGSGAASRRGILVRSAEAMERAATVEVVALDKTGTLTLGRPRVENADDAVLRIAAALAAGSAHPLSEAVHAAALERGLEVPSVTEVLETPGRGVRGVVDGDSAELLSASIAVAEGRLDAEAVPEGRTCSVLEVDGAYRGAITFTDPVRPDARDLVAALGGLRVTPMILTGDRRSVASELAAELGIPTESVHAELTPEGKVSAVTGAGVPVAMVGDGINDAGALAEASARGGVGLAIGAGTNIAIESADIVIPADRLVSIVDALRISRATRRTIRQNLGLSFLYNTCAIPVAALGFLGSIGPLVAGIAMGLSSVSVVANSLRMSVRMRRGV